MLWATNNDLPPSIQVWQSFWDQVANLASGDLEAGYV